MSASGLPFDDIRALLPLMPEASEQNAAVARAASPAGLGRLPDIAAFVAAWQAKASPTCERPVVVVFAASHGYAREAAAATRATMEQMGAGAGPTAQICATYGAGLKVFELALDVPVKDIAHYPAMTESECAATIAFGMEAIAGADLIASDAAAGGADLAAAALALALYGGQPQDWACDPQDCEHIARAHALHAGHSGDPLELLRRLGGRETAAIVGAVLAARMERVPVVLGGYPALAAAAVLHRLDAAAIDHCIVADGGAGAQRRLLQRLGKKPLLDMEIASGQGVGGALAIGAVQAALAAVRTPAG
ncbi:MAG: nicotinate-nucleotide--dimethylbenzimidazole phosphoribosyltransferase [Hyphomicrobiales bacterium]|nr:nicotinate-nucleotide--dimethylbenzimidazole phosphoribosyltransferase [Hyphomicrobiales bacterium]